MWKKFVRDYLSFTRNQRKGLFILGGLFLLCKTVPLLFPFFTTSEEKDSTDFDSAVTDFLARQKALSTEADSALQEPIQLFYFDPNTLSPEDWKKLGIASRTATTIQHYLEAGGRFYKKEDLQKIYGLSKKEYKRLAPYIRIRPPEKPTPVAAAESPSSAGTSILNVPASEPAKEPLQIDINKADSARWRELYGIGPVLSARIIKFRKALGGFYTIEQIREVYGLPDSTFRSIRKQLNLSTVSLRKLNINRASVDKLKSHPYISFRLAAAIKAFREMHGPFDSLPQLKNLQLVDDEIYRKLAPYLIVK